MIDAFIKGLVFGGVIGLSFCIVKFALGKGEETQPAEVEDHCRYAVVWTGEAKPRPFELHMDSHRAFEALMLRRGESAFPHRWRVIDLDNEAQGYLDPLPPKVEA